MHEIDSSSHPDYRFTVLDRIHRPSFPALPVILYTTEQSHETTTDDSSLQLGTQYRANIDGRSVHTITIDQESGTFVTDNDETFAIPTPEDTNSPIRSIAEVTVCETPDGGIQKDMKLIYMRPPLIQSP